MGVHAGALSVIQKLCRRLPERPALYLLLTFLLTRLLLVLVGFIAVTYLPMRSGPEYRHLDAPPVLDMWYRWDAGFYTAIAIYGYGWAAFRQVTADMAFLPLYPSAIRALNLLRECDSLECATFHGVLISNVALLIAAYALFAWVKAHDGMDTAYRTAGLMLLSLFGIFFSGVYTESLFLALSSLTFLALHKKRFALAVLTVCLACLTRVVGLALCFPLLVWAWENPAPRRFALMLTACTPALLFGLYMMTMGMTTGDPLGYFHANAQFWLRSGPQHLVHLLVMQEAGSWLDAVFAVFYLALAVLLLRKDRLTGTFALSALLLPLMSGNLASISRYGGAVFPFYWAIARYCPEKYWKPVVVAMTVLMIIFAVQFCTWHWVA